MIKRLKLSDKILFGTIAGLFVSMAMFLVWFRLNWESYLGWMVN
jgi:hypothetical protein